MSSLAVLQVRAVPRLQERRHSAGQGQRNTTHAPALPAGERGLGNQLVLRMALVAWCRLCFGVYISQTHLMNGC